MSDAVATCMEDAECGVGIGEGEQKRKMREL
jgi:hypothetical protein